MNQLPLKACAMALVMIVLGATAGTVAAAEDPTVLKDLTSVIALLGLPCGQVINVSRPSAQDQIAICKDGNRYRVFINPEGRVVAQKQ